MRLPFLTRPIDVAIEPLEPRDAVSMAALHAEGFIRPWSPEEFLDFMRQDTVFGFAARIVGRPGAWPAGFVLARLAAGEGEILTVTVARALRGQGLGRLLMGAVLRELHASRADALFLEVDEVNEPALALYRRLGFREVGRRPNYYARPGGPATGALVMRRDLR